MCVSVKLKMINRQKEVWNPSGACGGRLQAEDGSLTKTLVLFMKCSHGGGMNTEREREGNLFHLCNWQHVMYCLMSSRHGEDWCHTQTDHVHLGVRVGSLTMQISAARSDQPTTLCGWTCWLCVNGREAEVIYGLYWLYKCLPCVWVAALLSVSAVLYRSVGTGPSFVAMKQVSHTERTPLWKGFREGPGWIWAGLGTVVCVWCWVTQPRSHFSSVSCACSLISLSTPPVYPLVSSACDVSPCQHLLYICLSSLNILFTLLFPPFIKHDAYS